jgi:hypothetical protein
MDAQFCRCEQAGHTGSEEADMAANGYYRVNTPSVVHEVIDGEAVIVNLDTGVYYSVDGIGADIWSLIDAGAEIGQATDVVAARYVGDRGQIEQGVIEFVDQLRAEALVVPRSPDEAWQSVEVPPSTGIESVDGLQFEKPVLMKYTDMEDLLLLDPIHDVDDTGWPNVQSTTVETD